MHLYRGGVIIMLRFLEGGSLCTPEFARPCMSLCMCCVRASAPAGSDVTKVKDIQAGRVVL